MKDITDSLQEIAQLFDRMAISYAVMGGVAVRIYGIPRPTYDVDFTVAIDRNRLPDLYRALHDLGYTVPEEYAAGWVDRVADMPVVKARLYLEQRGVDIDIFLAESPYQQQLLARRRREELDGRPIWFVSVEDSVLLKLLAHRPRDMGDVFDILFVQGQLDETYLRHWADQLGVRDHLEEALAKQQVQGNDD